MILIIGLGNPGREYQKTRHNVGFRIVDKLRESNEFSDWGFKEKFKAEISESVLDSKKIILAKPQTFMNNSGKSAKRLINNYQLTINNLFVVHDDIDLPLGKIRVSKGRGSAGHKGVESIIRELKTPKHRALNVLSARASGQAKNFVRFRIGIQPKLGKPKKVEKFVLKKFTKDEEKIIQETTNKTCRAIELTVKKGVEKAMTEFNKS